jgi:energy-coupling factor transport system ATP-binding protein
VLKKQVSIIKTENLNYIYGLNTPFEKKAVNNVNLEIEKGEFVGVIGHTGSGKSTLIQHFNGLLKPTSGKVYIDGEDIWADEKNINKYRFKVGLVFQYPEYQLFEETVRKDIAFGPKNMGLTDEEIESRVLSSAKFVGLKEEMLDKSPFELSGGQKRRVAIAGVIAMDPEVLILDEPAAGLDPRGREKVLNQIKQYHNEKKNTVLLVSHSMEDIAKYATKVLVMNDSQVFMYDTVENVFANTEKLLQIGLDIPEISHVFLKLKSMGYNVNTNIYTVNQAKEEIKRLLK